MQDGVCSEAEPIDQKLFNRNFSIGSLTQRFFCIRRSLGRGVDRISSETFERFLEQEVSVISRKAAVGNYKFSPYLELLVSKGKNKLPRQISRPTIRDKICLGALKDVLHGALPSDVPRKLPNQVIRELVSLLALNPGSRIVKADIADFYGSIPHDRLMKILSGRIRSEKVLRLVERAIKTATVPFAHKKAQAYQEISKGVPQGLPISNFLANMFLVDFDNAVSARAIGYARYVDDIVMVLPAGSDVSSEISLLAEGLSLRGLSMSPDKTRPYNYAEPFEYLGYEISSGSAKPRRASAEKFVRSIVGLFAALKYKKFRDRSDLSAVSDEAFGWMFIHELNEKITGAISENKQYGWVFYFNESSDLTIFAEVDAIIKRIARKTDLLTNAMRAAIKSVLRAYHESKKSKSSGYIWNYDANLDPDSMRAYLIKLRYKTEQELQGKPQTYVEEIYRSTVDRRLKSLDRDVGLIS